MRKRTYLGAAPSEALDDFAGEFKREGRFGAGGGAGGWGAGGGGGHGFGG